MLIGRGRHLLDRAKLSPLSMFPALREGQWFKHFKSTFQHTDATGYNCVFGVRNVFVVLDGCTSTEPSRNSVFQGSLMFPDSDLCWDKLFLLMTLSSNSPRLIWSDQSDTSNFRYLHQSQQLIPSRHLLLNLDLFSFLTSLTSIKMKIYWPDCIL